MKAVTVKNNDLLPALRIYNSGWSVNCTAPINEAWMGCAQTIYNILHIIRQSNIIPIY